jgi:transposase
VETIVERCAGLDVHKAQVTACVRVPGPGRSFSEHVSEFTTTVQGLLTLRDWLSAHAVSQVAMEATGVYWKPVWAILEDDFDCLLVNARHVKNVPGRKTDVSDACWLARLLAAGLLARSFVPPKPIRSLRNLTRYRTTQIAERQREANRLHKILEDTGIKLDCVAADILGVSGRAMLDALVGGTTDPAVLAELARGRLRAKLPALREALQGRFGPEHALIVGHILAHLDFLDEAIAALGEAVEEQLRPFAPQARLLCTIPGVGQRTAEVLVAEIGVEMAQFGSAERLASWAGVCPGNDQSAGKRRTSRTRKGSKWLRRALTEAALAASRSKGTYLAAQYQRLKARRGHHRAILAVAHSILTAAWHMLCTGEVYRELGPEHFQTRNPDAQVRRLVRQLEALGHQVTLERQAA